MGATAIPDVRRTASVCFTVSGWFTVEVVSGWFTVNVCCILYHKGRYCFGLGRQARCKGAGLLAEIGPSALKQSSGDGCTGLALGPQACSAKNLFR